MTSVPATRPTAQATTTFSTAHFLLEALTGKVVDIVGHIASTLAAFDEKAGGRRRVVITGSITPPLIIEPGEPGIRHVIDPIGDVPVVFTQAAS